VKIGIALVVALLLTAEATTTGAADLEPCGRCHHSQVALEAATGGHAPDLDCVACHRDRRPGRFGRRHRAISPCASHHDTGPHPARAGAPRGRPTRNCLACHDVHGSPNAHLVRPELRVRRQRLVRLRFANESGAALGGFTDPAAPGSGLCEVCHRRTEVYRADGRGEPHFTESCILCHDHAASYAPIASEANCTLCHAAEGARFVKPNRHSAMFACGDCHSEVAPAPGEGHRRVAQCVECHDDRQTHAAAGETPQPCGQCHDAHGTENPQLVRERIVTTQGTEHPIRFDNVLGRAEGSFASASAPGTGICEVCHTRTRYYRADGSGEPHFDFSCLPCHLHARGFAPR
jgi:predicted CXXCH cytochrome family protein